VRDLTVPASVTVTTDADELVVQVAQPRGLDLPEEGEAAEGEEGAEGAEGGAAAGAEESGGDEA
jgi:hypothetical protein